MSEIQISAGDVKKLRDITGAGMMDCKQALAESNGDFEGAIEYLRKKGQKLSVKRADREAKEGVVIALVSDDARQGVVIRLSCETDFVAKNEDFINLAKSFAQIALDNMPADLEALLACSYDSITIGDKVTEQVGVIGEKIEIADYQSLKGEMVVPYIHMGYRAGVIVQLNMANPVFESAGKDVAMQIAAMKPVAVDQDGVNKTIIEKEIEIGKEVARQEGKPEAMLEKIAMGKLNKFFKESTLLNQDFVKDGSKSVAAYLKEQDPALTVVAFKHVMLG
jgi:elongation factor Ts